jgi:hypothetical protein
VEGHIRTLIKMMCNIDIDSNNKYSYHPKWDLFRYHIVHYDVRDAFNGKYGFFYTKYAKEILLSAFGKLGINLHDHLRLTSGTMNYIMAKHDYNFSTIFG